MHISYHVINFKYYAWNIQIKITKPLCINHFTRHISCLVHIFWSMIQENFSPKPFFKLNCYYFFTLSLGWACAYQNTSVFFHKFTWCELQINHFNMEFPVRRLSSYHQLISFHIRESPNISLVMVVAQQGQQQGDFLLTFPPAFSRHHVSEK